MTRSQHPRQHRHRLRDWRTCFVCHSGIPEGQSVLWATTRALVHRGDCDAVLGSLQRIYDRSARGRWRPLGEVRRLADGARCPACRPAADGAA